MKRDKNKGLNPILVIGSVLSVALGIVLYLLDVDKTIGFLFTFLGLVSTLQLELLARMQSTVELLRASVSILRKFAANPPWLFTTLEDCASKAAHALEVQQTLVFHDAVRRTVEDCRDKLDEISRGVLRTHSDDKRHTIRALQNATKHIRATSVVKTDLSSWAMPSGKRYLEENKAAISRGVHIERIFIYSEESADLDALIQDLFTGGCVIYTIPQERIPAERRIDMVIFDNDLVVETRSNAEGVFVENAFSANPSDLQRKIADFEYIRNLAELKR